MTKEQMTIGEFRKTPNVYPLTEGERYDSLTGRGIPPEIEIIDEALNGN